MSREWFTTFLVTVAVVGTVLRVKTAFGGTSAQPYRIVKPWTLRAMAVVAFGVLSGTLIEYLWAQPPIAIWRAATGFVILVAGFALRDSARRALGPWYSVHICLLKGQQVVTTGPYEIVRHPYYLGFAMEVVGFPLMAGAYAALIGGVVSFVPLAAYRGIVEERLLIGRTGEAYSGYRTRVSAVWPHLLKGRRR